MGKKIVIIGAGIAGLTAGIYGQIAGFDVEIYEQHTIVGGECTGWDRKGYHIDNCIHWLMGCVPGSDLYEIWKTVGAIVEDQVIQYESMYASELEGKTITLWKDIDRTERELIDLSPEDEEQIKDLMKYARLAQSVNIPCHKPNEFMGIKDFVHLFLEQKNSTKIFKHYKGKSTQDLATQFKHPLIRLMLSDFVTKESKAYSFIMAYGSFVAGNGGVPKGGSRAVAFRMQDKFIGLGGKVFTGTPIDKIVVDQKEKAKGIQLEDGSIVEADYIIPACDIGTTFSRLLNKSYMEPLLVKMYEERKQYPVYSIFQAAYAVDYPVDVMQHEYVISVDEIKTSSWMGERMTIKNYSYEPNFAPEGKQVVQVLYGGSEEGYDFFKELYKNKEEYNRYKEALAKRLMEKIEERFPEYKGKMTLLDAWTPMTYERYCDAYKGYYQAFMPTKNSSALSYPSPYIKGIDNIVIASQWLTPPGGCPSAAIAGKYAIMRIMNKENRVKN